MDSHYIIFCSFAMKEILNNRVRVVGGTYISLVSFLFIYSLIYSFIHLFISLFLYLFIYSCISFFIYLFITRRLYLENERMADLKTALMEILT